MLVMSLHIPSVVLSPSFGLTLASCACQWVSPSTACHGWLSQLILPGCQTSVGRYFDSDGYLGQEEILAEFSKLVEVSSFSNDGNGTSSPHFPVFLFPFMLS